MFEFYGIVVFIFGLLFGSFFNVCIYRLPKDKSIVFPGSTCPKCEKKIAWYDNIPVLSFLMLKGRCRQCNSKISLRYPLVEILTAVLFFSLFIKLGITVVFFKFCFLFALFIILSFIDIDYHAVPGYLCVFGIIVGLIFEFFISGGMWPILFDLADGMRKFSEGVAWYPESSFLKAIIALILGLGFTYLFKLFGDVLVSILLKIKKQEDIEGETESLGLGDVDFMGMVGVFLGANAVLPVFFIAPFFAILYAVIALLFKKSHLIPYLPYLSIAAIVFFFWGNKILSFFLF
ncbi:MAG: prepilin peptidase [Candidatus Omnitrophica bacterium]|nr:prepilin peptidase [Candidatus Omnitrophota bacterium]MDD5080916.1 prepilin peptidase [Candidatus Omnitrophota bacterium]